MFSLEPMHQFVKNLLTEWRRLELPFEGRTLVIGVSGGADSCSLLVAMSELVKAGKLGHRIVAGHFNHHLRGEASDADEAQVRTITSRFGVELSVGHAKTGIDGNLEQKAREERYAFLTATAEKVGASAILTGHTVNDQAETFLINLLRGSGPAGLSGMRPVREMTVTTRPGSDKAPELPLPASLLLVRPLLTWAKRVQTEGYCRDMDVDYCCDTMNEDTAFKRVRIRKILLPLLEDFNPKIVETLAKTASLMQMIPSSDIQMSVGDELAISGLTELSRAERYEALRGWIGARRGSLRQLQLKHIEGIERLALGKKSGRVAEIPGGRVIKSGGRLAYEENKVEKTPLDN